ncbi:Beta-1,4-mannooligosaccharide phosphorylase [Aureliella helgolandensis]|uniref:Beta-1,4-mannooligosaccharide phosphorylase n=1 Tax=Aureliella helgolandensis TaxID=2527968 RepID=A0A518G8M3_9BACT|nr:Beta-1,4-mannooligosaccharide phosphorylase [Aureliella helgolandensis]
MLRPSDIAPSHEEWEVVGVFNPAVAVMDDEVVMLVRVAERPVPTSSGRVALPRWQSTGDVTVDWFEDEDVQPVDARVVATKPSGNLRLTSISHLRVFRQSIKAPNGWRAAGGILPEADFECFGLEDPRITNIDGTFWITYVAVSELGAVTALLSSIDLVNFKRHGIIFPCENKDVVLFPQKIDGGYLALHRPNPHSHFSPPSIWTAQSPDLLHWGRHAQLLGGRQSWERDRVGAGTPPILIDEGWLMLFHGSETSRVKGQVGCYTAGALLLDRHNPAQILARSMSPTMAPTASFETHGFVPNVVFPTALLDQGDTLAVYYGAADSCVGMAEFSKDAILQSMTIQGVPGR